MKHCIIFLTVFRFSNILYAQIQPFGEAGFAFLSQPVIGYTNGFKSAVFYGVNLSAGIEKQIPVKYFLSSVSGSGLAGLYNAGFYQINSLFNGELEPETRINYSLISAGFDVAVNKKIKQKFTLNASVGMQMINFQFSGFSQWTSGNSNNTGTAKYDTLRVETLLPFDNKIPAKMVAKFNLGFHYSLSPKWKLIFGYSGWFNSVAMPEIQIQARAFNTHTNSWEKETIVTNNKIKLQYLQLGARCYFNSF